VKKDRRENKTSEKIFQDGIWTVPFSRRRMLAGTLSGAITVLSGCIGLNLETTNPPPGKAAIRPRPQVPNKEGRMTVNNELQFPEGFLWGDATAAYQVEGNCANADWYHWENEYSDFILDGTRSGLVSDFYHRFDEDFALAQKFGHNAHRLSIEWSRIEPEKGGWDYQNIPSGS
jgi:hypothetical protein